jgi:hypothetical protein
VVILPAKYAKKREKSGIRAQCFSLVFFTPLALVLDIQRQPFHDINANV